MPHQVAVLVNENSQASKKAANFFAARHGVPGGNLIYLDLPPSMFSGRFECSPEDFKTRICDPALKIIEDRGLDEQVLAWVYSVDFPIRIVTSPNDRQQMSIMGLTFLRGEVPGLEAMEKGQIVSPLFAGPGPGGDQKFPSRSFSIWAAGLKDKMPLPSMMLGYIGENGTDLKTVLRCIDDGVKARQRNAGPHILFVKTGDPARSEPREWQFDAVKSELAAYAGTAVVTTNSAPRRQDLTGVMTGAATVKPSDYGTFLPGAMAGHLTSWSAEFQKPQSKCTVWLDAGATVTAGMVTEPYNNWVKFPHARFFAHYAAGCTAMESFYQSIASPVQVLLLGNPLSQIAVLPAQIKAIGLSTEITSDLDAAFVAEAKFPVQAQAAYSALLNGKEIKRGEGNALVELPFDAMGDGYHEVRLIAQAVVPGRQVLPGSSQAVPVFINKKGRSLQITGMEDRDPDQIVVTAEPAGEEPPQKIRLLWNGRTLAEAAPGNELVFDEKTIGEGPHRLQAVAVYADGMDVRSEPAAFTIEFNPATE
jgi:uncharacterized protein (TIGR03790 family)